jgi:hypothetical protein
MDTSLRPNEMYILSKKCSDSEQPYIIGIYSSKDAVVTSIAASFPDLTFDWDEFSTGNVLYLPHCDYIFVDVVPIDRPNITD